MPSYEVIQFNQNAPARVADLAYMHEQLLPRSPVVKLGRDFMENAYYDLLIREGLVFGAVAYVDGKPAGFNCCTDDPEGFMQVAIGRHWPYICASILSALIRSPKRIAALYEGWRVMAGRQRPPAELDEKGGELLTTCVLPEYRSRSFYRETRLRIGEDLWQTMQSVFEARGIRVVKTVIDADNAPSRAYVQGQGWVLEADHVAGWKHPSVLYAWHAPSVPEVVYPPAKEARAGGKPAASRDAVEA